MSSSIIGSGVGARRPVNWKVLIQMATAWVLTLPAAAAIGFGVCRLTMLPGWWSATATGAVIVALLGWAARLMLHATTADDVAGETSPTRRWRRSGRQCGTRNETGQQQRPRTPSGTR